MNIQPIVEGHGEEPAVPVLLRRLCNEAQLWEIGINACIRCPRGKLLQEPELRRRIRLARLQPQCAAILLLFDSDDDCPLEVAPRLKAWAQDEASPIACDVVMAHREFEAWFLAAIESLRGRRGIRDDATSHFEPEQPRNAKARLEEQMQTGRTYMERADQVALTAVFDLATTYRRCRSFRKLTTAFGSLVASMGYSLPEWPPPQWIV